MDSHFPRLHKYPLTSTVDMAGGVQHETPNEPLFIEFVKSIYYPIKDPACPVSALWLGRTTYSFQRQFVLPIASVCKLM